MGTFRDLTGQTFGYLTAIKPIKKRDTIGRVIWECICTCGRSTCPKTIFIIGNQLCTGNSKSCKGRQHDKTVHQAIRQYFTMTRGRAKYRNHVFQLTLEQFITIICQPCNYCGKNDDIKRIDRLSKPCWALRCNGIDRWNNNLGYTLENCVPCCETCNRAKLEMTADEYINHCYNVTNHCKKDLNVKT